MMNDLLHRSEERSAKPEERTEEGGKEDKEGVRSLGDKIVVGLFKMYRDCFVGGGKRDEIFVVNGRIERRGRRCKRCAERQETR